MNAREMHYDFKIKLDKVDSQKNRNLLVPEIDWMLNEAQEIYIKNIIQPKTVGFLRFEENQRSIDSIRTLVENQIIDNSISLVQIDDTSYNAILPDNYMFKIGARVFGSKGSCYNQELIVRQVQHDDESEMNVFSRSNFEWRQTNIRFYKDGIRVWTDGTFSVDRLILNYIRKPLYIQNAQDTPNHQYRNLQNVLLTGSQSCELPEVAHREIVDLAVLIATGNLQLNDYQVKQIKTTFN